ncbi:probable leucine-rich repeat receptor-like serine/threonine-protein kinase At3g14840 isoform X4 [Fagus crenata]
MFRMFVIRLLLASAFTFYSTIFAFGAAVLVNDEVQALRDIAKKLENTKWNFSVKPCSGQDPWIEDSKNNVTCDCNFLNGTVCHVVSIVLKEQNLPGTLPRELVKFPYLQQIDLTRNYLNGTIPPEWGSMQLINISLLGNRLTGSIPKELGNITTLKSLVLEFNKLSGSLPEELGNLIHIERLHLTSNNFTGEIPETFAGLTNLTEFRISDNQFSGKIPDFIQNFSNLQDLRIQASGLNGPIPLGIASLRKLSDLRVSDIRGPEADFPRLRNMTNMKTLILRSCNITGRLPEYLGLGAMDNLKTLDLSFNKITGAIPSNYIGTLERVQFIYLAGNLLSGPVPDWMLKRNNM